MPKFEDLVGKKFGRLTVIKRVEDHIYPSGYHRPRWLCLCECGNEVIVQACHLKSGNTTSCGCFHKEKASDANKKHGLYYTRLHKIWIGMKARCYNPNNKRFKNYGARNIKVCDEWKDDFKCFYDWSMANGYDETAEYMKCTIDRIDVNDDYKPSNCRWVDIKTQNRNKRNNINITINGESHCLKDWCKILNLNYSTICSRINRSHWSIEKALEI